MNAPFPLPNIAEPDEEPRRVWLDDRGEVCCVVDAEDYEWAMQWKWRFKKDKRGRKFYACRNTRSRKTTDAQICVWMHKAILKERMKAEPPSPLHTIGDHGDGDSLNNRRKNLSWATPSMNGKTARRRAK